MKNMLNGVCFAFSGAVAVLCFAGNAPIWGAINTFASLLNLVIFLGGNLSRR